MTTKMVKCRVKPGKRYSLVVDKKRVNIGPDDKERNVTVTENAAARFKDSLVNLEEEANRKRIEALAEKEREAAEADQAKKDAEDKEAVDEATAKADKDTAKGSGGTSKSGKTNK